MLKRTFSKLKRSSLKKSPIKKKPKIVDQEEIDKMRNFFLSIWRKRSHCCTICGVWLGSEPRSYHFHHVIPKQRQKNYDVDITYDEKNIIFVCLDCHSGIETYGITSPSLDKLGTDLLSYYKNFRK